MGASELRVVVRATQMSVGSPAGHVVTLMVSLSPIHRPVMALHMQPVYTVLLGHGQRGLLGGPVPVPVAPVHAHKSDLWRPIRFNDTEDAGRPHLAHLLHCCLLRLRDQIDALRAAPRREPLPY